MSPGRERAERSHFVPTVWEKRKSGEEESPGEEILVSASCSHAVDEGVNLGKSNFSGLRWGTSFLVVFSQLASRS